MATAEPLTLTCVIASLACGGAERAMSRLCTGLVAAGHRVNLVTLNPDDADFFSVPPDVRRESVAYFGSGSCRWFDIAGQRRRLRALKAAILRGKPDVVISFGDATNVAVLQSVGRHPTPVIVAEHTDPRGKSIGWRWQSLRVLTYPRAARVVMLTDETLKWAKTRWPRWRACVIPNGIDPPSAVPRVPKPTSFGERNLVAMGRLAPEKGFDLLIDAYARIAPRHPGWSLTIFGEGSERPALEQLIRDHSLAGQISLPGRINNPEATLPLADIFVLSSRREGFPMVLLEAMAAGLPAVSFATPSGGPAIVIRDGIDGLLVPPEDAVALADALERLMTHDAERERLAHRATEVCERFSVERVLGVWAELLKSAVWEARSLPIGKARG